MKKYSWIVLFVWGLAGAAFAGPDLGFGLKAGVSLASQNYPNLFPGTTQGTLVGVAGGIFGDLKVLDPLAFQLEANFIQKGSSFSTSNFMVTDSQGNYLGTTTVTQDKTYDYLEIPFLIKGQMNLGSGWQVYLLAGPSLAFLLDETTTLTEAANGAVPYSSISVGDTSYFPSTDWTFVFGGGVEYSNFILDIRFGLGLDSANPVYPTPNTTTGRTAT